MKRAKLILAILIAVLVIILVAQNTESVETKLVFASVTMPRAMLLVITFLLGFAVGAVVKSGIYKK